MTRQPVKAANDGRPFNNLLRRLNAPDYALIEPFLEQAAATLGAGSWQRFRHIILPLLLAALAENGIADRQIHRHADVATAYAAARKLAAEADRIVVFGSFLTVAQVSGA